MKKETKKKILKTVLITAGVVGAGALVYMYVPGVKNTVNGLFKKTQEVKDTDATPIKTKPFRKYETYNKK